VCALTGAPRGDLGYIPAAMSLVDLSPEDFSKRLLALGQRRAYFVHDGHELRVSHPELREVADWLLGDPRDYRKHEGVFLEVGPGGELFGAFVHMTSRGQGQGGLRYWPYPSLAAFLRDGLRLATGMTRKNALAGLWWGGGKGLIARAPGEAYRDPARRAALYAAYGRFVTSLRGCYITAEDAGTGAEDMAVVQQHTRFVTCIPPAVGGSGNPSPATAKGVVCAMEGALAHLGLGTLAGKKIVMQGAGNVGTPMIAELLQRGVAGIVASELSIERRAQLAHEFAGAPLSLIAAQPGDNSILATPCDILAPNALGGILNPDTIPTIQASIVCGAANNQLLDDERDARDLAARGVVYVPDYLCNRMGIVHCANEQYGYVPHDPAIERHFGRDWDGSVFHVTRRALELAEQQGITTAAAANRLADERAREPHPFWGLRARGIVDGLVAGEWHRGH
jgi:glutamate dehydrogenase/leucine dehydrogenase